MKEESTTEGENEQNQIEEILPTEDCESIEENMLEREEKRVSTSEIETPDENVEERGRRYPLHERRRKEFPDMVQYMTWHEDSDRRATNNKRSTKWKR